MNGQAPTVWTGLDYSDDEIEFLKAMDCYKKSHPFPTCCEILAIAKSLGYRKVEAPCPIQTRNRDGPGGED